MTSRNERNKIYDFLYGLSKFIYIIGGPNFWTEQLQLPNLFHKLHKPLSIFMHALGILNVILTWSALYTQTDLSEKQKSDLLLFSIGDSIIYCYVVNAEYYAETIKEIFEKLTINSKNFNDKEIEKNTIKRMRYFSGFCMCLMCSALAMYGIEGYVRVLKYEGTFTTKIIAWPDVNDHGKAAGVVRILIFIASWIWILRGSSVSYCLIIPVTICLRHQFRNLKKYFYSLNDIFKGNEHQKEKEQRYEQGVKIGIQWHADILRCTKLAQKALAVVFAGQIVFNVTLLTILLFQFVNAERTLASTITTIITAITILFSTGCLMWNAGDITVEASELCTAIFESGWHNCRTGASAKVRSIITIAIWQSQRPVQLRCFGVVQMSYQSYLTIVKFSYSLFSVLY